MNQTITNFFGGLPSEQERLFILQGESTVDSMSDALTNTSWPSTATSADTRNLIGHFFALVDDTSASAGPELASKVFTKDGVMKAASGTFEGSNCMVGLLTEFMM